VVRKRGRTRPTGSDSPEITGSEPRPGSVRAAAASPHWRQQVISRLNGDVAVLRFNGGYQKARDRRAYPLRITVGVPLSEHDRASYPVAGESPKLAELSTAIARLAEGHGVLVGTSADSRGWIFLVYTASLDWIEGFQNEVRAAAADHLVNFRVTSDRHWKSYRELCPKARRPVRDTIVTFTILPLLGALGGASLGLIAALSGAAAILAWLVPVRLRRARLLSGQLAHPYVAFAAFSYILGSLFFPVAAVVGHNAGPGVVIAVAAGIGVLLTAAMWPAQRKFYARMRARAALQPPPGPREPAVPPGGP
jgi:hypothetical protein